MKLAWTDPAVADLQAIRDYIAHDSDHYAARFVARIIEAVEILESLPRIGRRVPEAPELPDVRELLFRNYRIIYRLEAERILILAVIHGSRDLAAIEPKPWIVE